MPSTLDSKIQATIAAEATLTADVSSLGKLEAAAAVAAEPVPGAQAQVNVDTLAFNKSLDDLAAAAIAAKLPPPVPVV